MSFNSGADPSRVAVIRAGLGNMTTLDETPPEFTHLSIQDPTAWNDRIQISFALNEPGTAYCRPTRSDSGETEQDMHIPWIQTAGWSNVHDGSTSLSTIVISQIENINSLGTNRINAPIQEALTQVTFECILTFCFPEVCSVSVALPFWNLPGTAVRYLLLGTRQCCQYSWLGAAKHYAAELCCHRCQLHYFTAWRCWLLDVVGQVGTMKSHKEL